MSGATTPTFGLASVNGIELAYQIYGSRRPLVLLHGGFGSSEMFGPNLAALAEGRQVIGVDLQSHGRTPAVERPMRFETMADDIAALIRNLGLERADLMGYSLGGGVALRTRPCVCAGRRDRNRGRQPPSVRRHGADDGDLSR